MQWSIFEREDLNTSEVAENEILSNDGFIYCRDKPNNKDISQLRHIKKLRWDNKYNTEIKPLINPITLKIDCLIGLRGKNRENKFNEIKKDFLEFLKKAEVLSFTRSYLFAMISDNVKAESKKKFITALIKSMKKDNLILEEKLKKHYFGFENKQLFSKDYGSYKLLIQKNKFKSEDKKGCYSDSNTSIKRKIYYYNVVNYRIN